MVSRLLLLSAVLATAALPAGTYGPSSNPDDQMRFFWYMTPKYYDRAVAAGFNTLINAFGANWYRKGEEERKAALGPRLEYIRRMERDGIDHIEQIKLSQCQPLRKEYPQVNRDGSRNGRSLDHSNPELRRELKALCEMTADEFRGLRAFRGVQTSTEVRDGSRPTWTKEYAEACEKALGFKPPERLTGQTAGHYSQFADFPVSRVVSPDYAPLRYYVWFWKTGDGWNDYQDMCAKVFRERLGQDLLTMYDPITRTPPLWGSGGGVSHGNQWFYEEPEPYGVSFTIAEQMAMSRGTPGQRVMTMLQGIAYRDRVAPKAKKVENEPAWVSDRPNATYITQMPDIVRGALWMMFSRQVDGIGVYAWNALLDAAAIGGAPKDAAAYQMTNPETFRVIEDGFRRAGVPLGPLFKAVPERKPEVALLESYASTIMTGVGSWGWGYRWGDLAVAANLQPYVIYEEEIARDGIPDTVRVLMMPDCPVLTEGTFDAVRAFQRRGGIVASDDLLVPGIIPDIVLPDYLLSQYDRKFDGVRDRETLHRAVSQFREDLRCCGYVPYGDGGNEDVVIHVRSSRDADYVFAVNDRRTFGDYVGQWKMIEERGLPNDARVSIGRVSGAVYDLVEHRPVGFEVRDGKTFVPLSWTTTDGRILLAVSKPLGDLSVTVCGDEVEVRSPDRNVMIPIEVSGSGQKPRYGVVTDGVWRRKYLAGTDLRVRNLADGKVFRPATAGGFDPPLPKYVRLDAAEVGFRAHFGVPKVQGMDVLQKEMLAFTVSTNAAGEVTAQWKGHPVAGPDFFVRALFRREGSGWSYSMETGGAEGLMRLESIEFPLVRVKHTAEASVVFSGPMGMGFRLRPDWRQHRQEAPLVEATPKAFQFIALTDGERSWYVDARDEDCHHKQVFARKDDGRGDFAAIGFRWHLPDDGRSVAQMPWCGLITPFAGDWFAAASIYGRWARATSRAKRAFARDPGQLRDIALWAWNRGTVENVVPPLERVAADAGVPVALDWYWWHDIPYDTAYPGFWPPREGVDVFTSAIRRLKAKGIYTMAYVNGLSWDRDDGSWARGGENEVVMDHDISYSGVPYNCFNGHRLARMCCEPGEFQRSISEVVRHLAESGLDAVYLDQISCSGTRTCWNPRHAHVKGGGNYFSNGYRAFVARIARENPSLQLSSEEATEDFIDSFDSFISVVGPSYERSGYGTLPEMESLPVWNAIYHGAVTCFGNYTLMDGIAPYDPKWPADGRWKPADEKDWPSLYPDQFAIEFSRGVAWGNQPTVHNLRMYHVTEKRFAADYRFIVETVRFYHANRDFLYDGEMCDPGILDCEKADVPFMRRATYARSGEYEEIVSKGLPRIFHGIWRAKDGRVRAILVNWSRQPVKYALTSPLGTCSGEMPPRSWRIEELCK